MEKNIFGRRLKKLRERRNLKSKELAEIFQLAESTISGYENGHRKPDMETLLKFADYFNVEINYFFGRDNKADGNLFFFDKEGLTEDEIDDIMNHIEYIKWKNSKNKADKMK